MAIQPVEVLAAPAAEPLQPTDAEQHDQLQMPQHSHSIAYRRYVQSGGDERSALALSSVTDALRKYQEAQAKQHKAVGVGETKITAACCEIVTKTHDYFTNWLPKQVAITCEGYGRVESEPRIKRLVDLAFHHIGGELVELFKENPLLAETLFGPGYNLAGTKEAPGG